MTSIYVPIIVNGGVEEPSIITPGFYLSEVEALHAIVDATHVSVLSTPNDRALTLYDELEQHDEGTVEYTRLHAAINMFKSFTAVTYLWWIKAHVSSMDDLKRIYDTGDEGTSWRENMHFTIRKFRVST